VKTSASVCPVSAATLDLAPGLGDTKVKPGSVKCWKTWAAADNLHREGDGFLLFRYFSGSGWHFFDAGSGFNCKDLDIHDWDPKNPPPFCG
jgi:hypothetical protein